MSQDKIQKAIEATRILNEFVGDLIVGTQVMVHYGRMSEKGQVSAGVARGVLKMCLSHLTITLGRFCEFYKHYKAILPDDCAEQCKKIFIELRRRDVQAMRNKVFAHIWDDDQGRPLKLSEIVSRMEQMFGPDTHVFFRWVNDPKNNQAGKTIVGSIEFTRDQLINAFNLANEEIFPDR